MVRWKGKHMGNDGLKMRGIAIVLLSIIIFLTSCGTEREFYTIKDKVRIYHSVIYNAGGYKAFLMLNGYDSTYFWVSKEGADFETGKFICDSDYYRLYPDIDVRYHEQNDSIEVDTIRECWVGNIRNMHIRKDTLIENDRWKMTNPYDSVDWGDNYSEYYHFTKSKVVWPPEYYLPKINRIVRSKYIGKIHQTTSHRK